MIDDKTYVKFTCIFSNNGKQVINKLISLYKIHLKGGDIFTIQFVNKLIVIPLPPRCFSPLLLRGHVQIYTRVNGL